MTNDFFTPSGVPDVGTDAAPANPATESTSAPAVPAGVTAPSQGTSLDIATATKAAEGVKALAEKSRNDMMAPQGVPDIDRDENGRFVGKNTKAEDPTATRPGADYAKADPAATKDERGTKGESGAKADVPATPTWRSTLAKDWGIGEADVDEAAVAIGADFNRTIEGIQSGKINLSQQQESNPTQQQAAEPAASQPGEQKSEFEKYTDAEIKALEDNFDEDTARLMQRMARQHNIMADRLSKMGNPDQIAQQVQQQAAQKHAEHVNRTIVTPFFDGLTKQFPELAATYGGDKPNQAQIAARVAHCQAAGQYMTAKQIQGKPVTEAQALQATAQGWYAEQFEKAAKSNERRASATTTRHRARDIGASSGQNGSRTQTNASADRLAPHRAFLNGDYGTQFG